ncbi:MAG: ComEC/Rec2 family competence protein [Acidobacteria bacterium]|nr:ComEC/Rec2 family competence protein [Acidobacteriota bacterium]
MRNNDDSEDFRSSTGNRKSSILHRLSSRPAAALTLSFCAGIASSLLIREYSFSGFVAANAFLICAASLALTRNRITPALATGLAAIAITGLLLSLAHRDGISSTDLRRLFRKGIFPLAEPVMFEGCVIEESHRQGEESSSTIRLNAFLRKDQWLACKGGGILRIAEPDPGDSAPHPISLERGDRIRGWATWNTPRNYHNPGSADRAGQLARRDIFLLGRVKSPRLLEKIPGGCSNPLMNQVKAVRARVRSSLDPIATADKSQLAAVLASLTIGEYSGLNNSTREVFQNSGTYHVLVVSGLHVAWIAGLLLQITRLFFIPEKIRYLSVALAIFFYTCIVGFQASITRCLWMFLLYLAGRMIFRKADPTNILLASALILLAAQPDWLFETGFQLSFLSVMAIAMTAAPAINGYLKPCCEPLMNSGNPDRLFLQPGRWHRYGRMLRTRSEILVEAMTDSLPPTASRILLRICRGMGGAGLAIGSMVIASISVQLWIEPLLALNFNRMSWISPLANVILVPLSSIVLAAGIAASIFTGLPHIGPACLQLAEWLASFLLDSAESISGISGAWQRCPTPAPAWVLSGILILFLWSFFKWRRFWIPCAYIIVLLACLSHGSVPVLSALFEKYRYVPDSKKEEMRKGGAHLLKITFLDVGEGDSIVIHFPDGRFWIIDAGGLRLPPSHEGNAYSFDIGEAVVSRYLWHSWAPQIDRLILTHTDQDHAGGMPAVLKNFRVSEFGYSGTGSDTILAAILSIVREKRIAPKILQAGMQDRIGAVNIRTHHPPADSGLQSANDNSIVLHFSFGYFSALLTGDLEKAGEVKALLQTGDLRSLLLKVAHHGSRSGTSDAFLDRVAPRWAVVSAGWNNPFSHPSPEVIARLRKHGVQSLLTLNDGAITFETDGTRYAIKTHIRGILEQGFLRQAIK